MRAINQKANFELAANIAVFLMDKVDSVCGVWSGKMTKKQQIEVFGCYIGKGVIVVDGTSETVQNVTKTCFGYDTEVTFGITFNGIVTHSNKMIEIGISVKMV